MTSREATPSAKAFREALQQGRGPHFVPVTDRFRIAVAPPTGARARRIARAYHRREQRTKRKRDEVQELVDANVPRITGRVKLPSRTVTREGVPLVKMGDVYVPVVEPVRKHREAKQRAEYDAEQTRIREREEHRRQLYRDLVEAKAFDQVSEPTGRKLSKIEAWTYWIHPNDTQRFLPIPFVTRALPGFVPKIMALLRKHGSVKVRLNLGVSLRDTWGEVKEGYEFYRNGSSAANAPEIFHSRTSARVVEEELRRQLQVILTALEEECRKKSNLVPHELLNFECSVYKANVRAMRDDVRGYFALHPDLEKLFKGSKSLCIPRNSDIFCFLEAMAYGYNHLYSERPKERPRVLESTKLVKGEARRPLDHRMMGDLLAVVRLPRYLIPAETEEKFLGGAHDCLNGEDLLPGEDGPKRSFDVETDAAVIEAANPNVALNFYHLEWPQPVEDPKPIIVDHEGVSLCNEDGEVEEEPRSVRSVPARLTDGRQKPQPVPLRISSRAHQEGVMEFNFLVLDDNCQDVEPGKAPVRHAHMAIITNFDAFCTAFFGSQKNHDYTCRRCFHTTRFRKDFETHLEECNARKLQVIDLPSEEGSYITWTNVSSCQQAPGMIFADFEAAMRLLTEEERMNAPKTADRRHSAVIGSLAVMERYSKDAEGHYHKLGQMECTNVQTFQGPNCAWDFCVGLLRAVKALREEYAPLNVDMDSSGATRRCVEKDRAKSKRCYLCHRSWEGIEKAAEEKAAKAEEKAAREGREAKEQPDETRQADHCHITGAYLGMACGPCNRARSLKHWRVPVVFHNANYDLSLFQTTLLKVLETEEFKGLSGTMIPLSNSGEKQIAALWPKFKIIDSFRFIPEGLAGIMAKVSKDPSKLAALRHVFRHKAGKGPFPMRYGHSRTRRHEEPLEEDPESVSESISDGEEEELPEATFKLLLSKLMFPYEVLKDYPERPGWGPDHLEEMRVSDLRVEDYFDRSSGYDKLSVMPPEEQDALREGIERTKRLAANYGIENALQLCQFYCMLDTVQLACCFTAFCDMLYDSFGTDPSWMVTGPGYAYMTLIREWDLHRRVVRGPGYCGPLRVYHKGQEDLRRFAEEAVLGGFSGNFNRRHVKANNKHCRGYDRSKPNVWIAGVDVNSQYPSAIMMNLPVANYAWVPKMDFRRILKIADPEGETGYMLEVDGYWDPKCHDKLRAIGLLPLPVKREVKKEELSEATQLLYEDQLKSRKGEKLVMDLGPQQKLKVELGRLRLAMQEGFIVTKVHRIQSYTQCKWGKPFISKMFKLRQAAERDGDSVKSYAIKILMNSTYGRLLMNQTNKPDVALMDVSTERGKRQWTNWVNCNRFETGEEVCEGVILAKRQKKRVVVNTPVLAGAVVLNHAKAMIYEHALRIYNVVTGVSEPCRCKKHKGYSDMTNEEVRQCLEDEVTDLRSQRPEACTHHEEVVTLTDEWGQERYERIEWKEYGEWSKDEMAERYRSARYISELEGVLACEKCFVQRPPLGRMFGIYSDTDSYYFVVEGVEDLVRDVFAKLCDPDEESENNHMDLSEYDPKGPYGKLCNPKTQKLPSLISDEVPNGVITEFVALGAKLYCYTKRFFTGKDARKEDIQKKAKGVPRAIVRNQVAFDAYTRRLHALHGLHEALVAKDEGRIAAAKEEAAPFRVSATTFLTEKRRMFTEARFRSGLGTLDDKQHFADPDQLRGTPFGHYSLHGGEEAFLERVKSVLGTTESQ